MKTNRGEDVCSSMKLELMALHWTLKVSRFTLGNSVGRGLQKKTTSDIKKHQIYIQ